MSSGLASNASEFFPAGHSGDSSVTRADRLAWLLQGLLEAQSLITDEASELAAFMQRVVDLGARGFDTQVGRGTTFWVDFPLAADA
jgi:hypothetical protein